MISLTPEKIDEILTKVTPKIIEYADCCYVNKKYPERTKDEVIGISIGEAKTILREGYELARKEKDKEFLEFLSLLNNNFLNTKYFTKSHGEKRVTTINQIIKLIRDKIKEINHIGKSSSSRTPKTREGFDESQIKGDEGASPSLTTQNHLKKHEHSFGEWDDKIKDWKCRKCNMARRTYLEAKK